MVVEKCLIIGSGCAGLTAGIYSARSNLNPLIISGIEPGGQLMLTSDVENYPGFENPITGPDLMENMRKQCVRLGVRFAQSNADKVDFKSQPLRVWTSDGLLRLAQSVIIATGANAKWLRLPSEEKFRGKGVSACATCDGFFFKGKDVVVVGGGDTAMEEATFLSNLAKSVSVIHRRDQLRASAAMQEKARKKQNIRFVFNSVLEEILGGDMVTSVRVRNSSGSALNEIPCQGVFIAIGHEPATGFLKGELELDEKGYIRTVHENSVKTNLQGVFACGDCVDHRYRQAVTASGMGSMAAMEANWWLQENRFNS